jgi:hypothetical protein
MRWTGLLSLAAAAIGVGAADALSLDLDKVIQPDGFSLAAGKPQRSPSGVPPCSTIPRSAKAGSPAATATRTRASTRRPFRSPYPHFVKVAKANAGLDQVNAADMEQLRMVVPMQTEPLGWRSEELVARIGE